MKKSLLALLLCGPSLAYGAQNPRHSDMTQVEAKIALRELVDRFSLLADRKETLKQTELFTENAVVESHANGSVSTLTGRKAIGDAFGGFLANFATVYHLNGQHVVSVKGNTATGELYCLVYLFSVENGKKWKTNFGVRYNDEYTLVNDTWLISKRTSFFEWQTREEVTQ